MTAIENPGDGKGAPLFHLLNGDLCYANLDIENAPSVWRDFGINVARSSANRPWLPALGNHETEFGTYSHSGKPGDAPGGIAAQGAAGNYWNGPYGYGHYLSQVPAAGQRPGQLGRQPAARQLLRLPGRHGQVHLAGRRRRHLPGRRLRLPELGTPNAAPETTSSGAAIPNGTVTYNRFYTGDLKPEREGRLPGPGLLHGTPNLQTLWLEETLAQARHDPSVDMIVVFMHQCAMSTSVAGNGSDLGIRQAWLPLFDKYEVDLVLPATSTTTSAPTRSAATTRASLGPSSTPTRTRPSARRSTPAVRRSPPPSRYTQRRPGGVEHQARARSSWFSAAAAPTARPTRTGTDAVDRPAAGQGHHRAERD